ncbi:hypothetical protein Hanom_Chr16g01456981 [Helianthus anomalus]
MVVFTRKGVPFQDMVKEAVLDVVTDASRSTVSKLPLVVQSLFFLKESNV